MALVIVGWLLTACVLGYQAVHTLRTGQASWFCARSVEPGRALRPLLRLVYAILYAFPAVAIAAILTNEIARTGIKQIEDRIISNLGLLLLSSFFLIMGMLLLVRPERTLRWTLRTDPEVVEGGAATVVGRLIGVAFMAFALITLAHI
jgi:hypothetical protein